jgi:hypothetical protein
MALLSASVGIVKLLGKHPQFEHLRPTILWTEEQLSAAIKVWPVARDGAPLVTWVHHALKKWEERLTDIPLTVAVRMAEQMVSDLAVRLRDWRKLALLEEPHSGLLGLADQVDNDGDYEACSHASEMIKTFYANIGFIP